jgi:hypothetical protein
MCLSALDAVAQAEEGHLAERDTGEHVIDASASEGWRLGGRGDQPSPGPCAHGVG